MITAVIVEDETSSKEYLLSILTEQHPTIQVLDTASNVDDAVTMIKTLMPDIVFLDIQLNERNSFEILDQLQHKMPFEVIFTTGYLDYKERAMDYFAFYYLNKPIQPHELKKVLDMYVTKRSSFDVQKYLAFKQQIGSKNNIINFLVKDMYVPVKLEDILYCQASGNYTFIHTIQGEKILTSKNLKRIEDLIEDESFMRVHRASLVNMKHVKSISKDATICMVNNDEIMSSVRNKKKVIAMYQLFQQGN